MNKVYQRMVDFFVEKVTAAGELPWMKPWDGTIMAPKNLITKKPYRGFNTMMLAFEMWEHPWWISYKQAKALGGQVRKGERSTPVVFWKLMEPKDQKPESRAYPIIRYYNIFNVGQVDGIEDKIPETPRSTREHTPIELAEQIIAGYPEAPPVHTGKLHCCYYPQRDVVEMTRPELFLNDESYYASLFHELVHSTGNGKRLSRKGITDLKATYGDETYGKEELVAEIGASFLCAEAGFLEVHQERSAAYVKSWLNKIKGDPTLIVSAAQQAQKALDYIIPVRDVEQEQTVAA